MIVTLIPAAGHSSRMRGTDKLLEPIGGKPILRRVALTALKANLGPVIVTLPPRANARRNALRNLNLTMLEVPDASEGMSASLRAGAVEAHRCVMAHDQTDNENSGMLVMLPDMPDIEASDLQEIAHDFSASGGTPHRAATEDGVAGHPVLFPAHMLNAFQSLSGDQGARSILKGETVLNVPLAGNRAITDLDTPEAWQRWRADTQSPA